MKGFVQVLGAAVLIAVFYGYNEVQRARSIHWVAKDLVVQPTNDEADAYIAAINFESIEVREGFTYFWWRVDYAERTVEKLIATNGWTTSGLPTDEQRRRVFQSYYENGIPVSTWMRNARADCAHKTLQPLSATRYLDGKVVEDVTNDKAFQSVPPGTIGEWVVSTVCSSAISRVIQRWKIATK